MNLNLELIVKLNFKATHVLEENEQVHPHTWRVDVRLAGKNLGGRIVSLPKAQAVFNEVLKKLEGTHLNSNRDLDNASREVPTCENLCYFLFEEFDKALTVFRAENPSLKIVEVEVAVSETDDKELGAARLTANP